jgi:protein CpxP
MKITATRILGTGFLAAGLMAAQAPAPAAPAPQQPGQRMGRGMMRNRGMMMGRMAQRLNLTDAQKAQAKEIFQAARDSAKPVAADLANARKALRDAVKTNAPDAQIDHLSTNVGTLQGQLIAIRTKAFSKFYNTVLTPEQRDQAGTMMQRASRRVNRAAPARPPLQQQ